MTFKNPSTRTLILCWVVLMALTIGTMISGRATSDTALTAALVLSLGLITWVKSMLILRYYLNLRTASKGWIKGFKQLPVHCARHHHADFPAGQAADLILVSMVPNIC